MLSTAPHYKIHFRITYQNKGPINLYNLLFLYTFYTLTLDLLTTVIENSFIIFHKIKGPSYYTHLYKHCIQHTACN